MNASLIPSVKYHLHEVYFKYSIDIMAEVNVNDHIIISLLSVFCYHDCYDCHHYGRHYEYFIIIITVDFLL